MPFINVELFFGLKWKLVTKGIGRRDPHRSLQQTFLLLNSIQGKLLTKVMTYD